MCRAPWWKAAVCVGPSRSAQQDWVTDIGRSDFRVPPSLPSNAAISIIGAGSTTHLHQWLISGNINNRRAREYSQCRSPPCTGSIFSFTAFVCAFFQIFLREDWNIRLIYLLFRITEGVNCRKFVAVSCTCPAQRLDYEHQAQLCN